MSDAMNISGALKWDISEYARGMMQATSIASLFPATVTNFMANPLLGVIGIAKDVAQSIVGIFSADADYAEKIGNMSTNLGVGTEFLSGFGKSAEMSGSSLDGFADSVKFLNKALYDARNGGKDAKDVLEAFQMAGVKDFGQSTEKIYLQIADGIQGIGNAATRQEVAMRLFGRSGNEMIAMLAGGSEPLKEQMRLFSEYGFTVSQAAADSAGAWNNASDEMGVAWEGIKRKFSEQVRIALLPQLQTLLEWVRTHPREMDGMIKDFATGVVAAANVAGQAIVKLIGDFDNLGRKAAFAMGGSTIGGVGGAFLGSYFGPLGTTIGKDLGLLLGGLGGNAIADATRDKSTQLEYKPIPLPDWANSGSGNVTINQHNQFNGPVRSSDANRLLSDLQNAMNRRRVAGGL
jgi:hypothetical protein